MDTICSGSRKVLLILAAIAGLGIPPGFAVDHRDGPRVGPTALAGLYAFRSPTNANNNVLILTASPFADFERLPRFSTSAKYEIKVDQTGDSLEELTLRISFARPDGNGTQPVRLELLQRSQKPLLLAQGATGTNIPIEGGGLFRAGLADDPDFMDQTGLEARLAGPAPFPRPIGVAKNLYGPNANVLAIVIEVPRFRLVSRLSGNIVALWGRVTVAGRQVDRVGRPLINTMLIPPIPTRPITRENPNLRARFNAARPALDVKVFTLPMVGVLQRFYAATEPSANTSAAMFLPDVLIFDTTNPNGYGTFITTNSGTMLGNGRRLRDDVFNITSTLLGPVLGPTDNVADDNETRITDGNMGTTAAFPYIGSANLPGAGPNL